MDPIQLQTDIFVLFQRNAGGCHKRRAVGKIVCRERAVLRHICVCCPVMDNFRLYLELTDSKPVFLICIIFQTYILRCNILV